MIRPLRLTFIIASAASLLCASSALILRAGADTPATPPASQPSTQPALAFAAMDYYDTSCARCHGPEGSTYGSSLGRDLDDKGLIKVCQDMADGPGHNHIEPAENLTETAFHRSLIMHTPYLSLTKIEGVTWSGEVMIDAKVTLAVGNKTIDAKVDDWNWTATLPENTNPAAVTITATLEGKTTTIKPAEATYSHTTPIPTPDKRPKK